MDAGQDRGERRPDHVTRLLGVHPRHVAPWSGQFPDRALDRRVHKLPVALGISHHSVPMQAHVGRPVAALQDKRLQTPLLAEGVIRGVAKEIVHTRFPDSGLYRFDDRGHSAVELPGHVD